MLTRNIIRSVAPLAPTASMLCTKAAGAASHGVKHTILSSSHTSSSLICSARISALRFYSQEASSTENLPVVDFNEVKRATTQNEVVIIDVREPDEVKELGKIPNSINIPLGSINATLTMSEKEFQKEFNRAKPKENTQLIFYCMIGKRSGKAQQSAHNLGFKNTKNYLGSWTDWAAKNQ